MPLILTNPSRAFHKVRLKRRNSSADCERTPSDGDILNKSFVLPIILTFDSGPPIPSEAVALT